MQEEQFDETSAPYERMIQSELKTIVYNFCTLCSLLENKKLSVGNIFTILTQDEGYREIYQEMLSEDNLIESLKIFLLIFPDILSNKSIKTIVQEWK